MAKSNSKFYNFKHDYKKTNDNDTINGKGSRKINATRKSIKKICNAFILSHQDFRAEKSVERIKKHIDSNNKINRLLYSEISKYLFSLNEEDRGLAVSNIDALLQYCIEKDIDEDIDEDVLKIVIKIYDHSQLVLHQVENARTISQEQIDSIVNEAKEDVRKETKNVQREHITILGIFTSVVIAFVGGMAFTTSVLQNIDKPSIFRLILVICLIAFVLFNLTALMIKFLFSINDKEDKICKGLLKKVNGMLLLIIIIDFISWCYRNS